MNQNRPSIDGFIPRRRVSNGPASGDQGLRPSAEASRNLARPEIDSSQSLTHNALRPSATSGLTRADLDQSLTDIGNETDDNQRKRRRRSRRLTKKQQIKRVVVSLLIILLLVGGFLGVKVLLASGSIFKGGLLGLVQSKPLREDANGRSNILVFGTSEDDKEGGMDHPGELLTDSMMVVSVDQKNKSAITFSVPRDLVVEYGQACVEGYYGRINSYYQCVANDQANSPEGASKLKNLVGEVFGLDIQYYAHINYSVVKDSVDAVGGIEVDIKGEGPVPYGVKPGSILDRNFDWKCNYQCYYVKYEPGVHKLDGEHALALARARGANGGYGLPKSNFNREINQQKIAMALVKKASSAGTLTNLGKVTSLIDAMGNNLRTNFETSEIRTLMDLGSELAENNQMESMSLIEAEPPILTSGNEVNPVLGQFNYSDIQAFIKRNLSTDPIIREQAKVGVYNGSGVAGLAGVEAEKLRSEGFTIVDNAIGNAPEAKYAAYEIYDLTGSKSATKKRLESRYQTTAKTTQPPVDVSGLDFVVVIGRPPAGD